MLIKRPVHVPVNRPIESPIDAHGLVWESGGSPSGGAAVDPILATSPFAAWRADTVTLSGSDATVITDRSGNGRDMTAVNAAEQIDGALGQKALDVVAASSEHYQAGDIADVPSGALNAIDVVKIDANGGYVISKRVASDGWGTFIPTTSVSQTIADGTLATVTNNGTINLTDPFYLRTRIRVGTDVTMFVDGTGTPNATDPGPINNANQLTLFARADGGGLFFDGQWYETILYDRDLTAPELTTILDYLNARYGLAKAGV